MKRSIIITVLLLAVLLGAATTISAKPKFTTGPKIGINIATVAGKDTDNPDVFPGVNYGYIAGGYFGWTLSAELNDYLAIQIEPGYTQRGGEWEQKYTIADTAGTSTQNIRLNYFTVPLLVKITLPREKIRPFLCTGFGVAFNTSATSNVEDIAYANNTKVKHYSKFYDEVYNPKSTIFDASVGIGLETTWRNKKISLEGRYTFSFGKVFDDVDNLDNLKEGDVAFVRDEAGTGIEFRHSLFSILIGVSFPI